MRVAIACALAVCLGAGPPGAPAAAAELAAESEEETTQVVFRVPDPVSVESGHSLVVAIVNREIPTRRIAHYQPQSHPRHPLAAAHQAFERLAELQRGVESRRLRIEELRGEQKRIYEDQGRIRNNLDRVQRDSTLFQRYVKKLSDREIALETIVEQIDQAERRQREASDALAASIRDLKV